MNFGVAKEIENLQPRIFSKSYHDYTSEPARDLNSPGVVLKLYSDVVPIVQNVNTSNVTPKLTDDITTELSEQSGSGLEKSVENSFLHPRPIKTETIELLKLGRKRKEPNKEENKKKSKMNHKFSLV